MVFQEMMAGYAKKTNQLKRDVRKNLKDEKEAENQLTEAQGHVMDLLENLTNITIEENSAVAELAIRSEQLEEAQETMETAKNNVQVLQQISALHRSARASHRSWEAFAELCWK